MKQAWVLGLALVGCAGPSQSPDTSAAQAPAPEGVVAPAAHSTMLVHFIDVGQGAATLFEFADGAVLVDTGGEENRFVHSDALLQTYLDAFFARRADLHGHLASVILTHPHLDHTHGVHVVIEHYAPGNVVTNGQTYGSGSAQQNELIHWAADHHDVGYEAVALDHIPPRGLTDAVIDPVHGAGVDPVLTVLWGQVASDPGWGAKDFKNNNNHSVVVRVDFGKASVLVTGDLEEPAIRDILKRYQGTRLLDADIYEVGHHGSINGTIPEFVDAVTPSYAVIECGRPDHEAQFCAWAFGHPRAEVVEMLQQRIPTPRPEIQVQVGLHAKTFEARTVSKAIYATRWDGNVVLEVSADGGIRRVEPAP
jgi:competence protein ComEC